MAGDLGYDFFPEDDCEGDCVMPAEQGGGREVLIEIMQVGNAVKVSAVDPATGVEVSIVGSPSAGEETLKRNAVNKLNYVLHRRRAERAGRT